MRGRSTGDFAEASGFSATTVTRLLKVWQEEYSVWGKRSLAGKEYVYVWTDGVCFNVRLEEDRLACLVIVGVLPNGRKEVIALEDGYREPTESWTSVLRDLKRRGMVAPLLVIGDGNLSFWLALRDVYPETKGQRCWKHRLANVLDKLPKRLQAKAKEQLHEIMYAPDRASALEEIAVFEQEYSARYPKAVETLCKDQEQMLTFFDFPDEHWRHLRTTNPIESTFATVKARTKRTKGAGSRKAGLAMAWKLLMAAQQRWHRVNAPHLVALVKAAVAFPDGQAEMLQCGLESEELFILTPEALAADVAPIHSI